MRDVTDRVGDGRRGELAGVEAVADLPPGVVDGRWGADASAAWAVPGGWEAARITWDGASSSPLDVWRSADGVTWERVAALESPAYNRGHGVAVADDGTRIRWDGLTISPDEGVIKAEGLLRASADGATWTALGTFPGADVSITRGAANPWSAIDLGRRGHRDPLRRGRGDRLLNSAHLDLERPVDLDCRRPRGAGWGGPGSTGSRGPTTGSSLYTARGCARSVRTAARGLSLADRRAVGLIADGPAGIIRMRNPVRMETRASGCSAADVSATCKADAPMT